MIKKIYVSGPYRSSTEWGVEDNIRRAEVSAVKLWQEGYAVFCPHKNSAHLGGIVPDNVFLAGDLEILKRFDIIFMLKGWEQSIGACIELHTAQEHCLEVMYE